MVVILTPIVLMVVGIPGFMSDPLGVTSCYICRSLNVFGMVDMGTLSSLKKTRSLEI